MSNSDFETVDSLRSAAFSLHERGELAAAELAYRKVLGRFPDDGETGFGFAVLMLQLGRFDVATEPLAAAAGRLQSAEAFDYLGNAYCGSSRFAEALQSHERAIALDPRHAPAHLNRGNVLRLLGRPREAIDSFARATQLAPDFPEAHAALGAALLENRASEGALSSLQRALSLRPDAGGELHANIAAALAGLGRFAEMLRHCDLALEASPDDGRHLVRRAAALLKLGRSADALADAERALRLEPAYPEVHVVRGSALREMQRVDEAIVSFETAVALQPGNALGKFALGCLYLMRGQLERGWPLYAGNGWASKPDGKPAVRRYPQGQLRSVDAIAGRTLYLYPDQGLGDTIQFARYAQLLRERGATVILSVQDRLCRLMSSMLPEIRVLGEFETPAEFDFHSPLAELPGLFSTTLETIPASVPYLRAEVPLSVHWRERLGTQGFKVGVCWQGSGSPSGAGRSFAADDLRPLAMIRGVRLISLQRTDGVDPPSQVPHGMRIEHPGAGFDAGPDAFIDACAVMQNLDLVVTCDTSIAHLAGALGRPTWVALKYVPDWRWMLDREDTPWYPTMQLFRQSRDGDWGDVFGRMSDALARQLASRTEP